MVKFDLMSQPAEQAHGKETWWARSKEVGRWMLEGLKFVLAGGAIFAGRPDLAYAAGGSWIMEKILLRKKAH
jgi:hypothetical protein